MSWERKDVWSQDGKHFRVEVSRHEVKLADESACYDSEGPHRWCIYAYVYPKHPRFVDFDPAAPMYSQPSFGMHAGLSYFRVHRNNAGEVCSFQIGCDYNHLDDWYYTQMATKDDALSVFCDADDLVATLTQTGADA